MTPDKRLELRHDRGVRPASEVRFDSFLNGVEAKVLETCDLRLRKRLVREVRKRRPTPERQGAAKVAERCGIVSRETVAPLLQQLFEAVRVQLVRPQPELIASITRQENFGLVPGAALGLQQLS
jgi:hypothetical protein